MQASALVNKQFTSGSFDSVVLCYKILQAWILLACFRQLGEPSACASCMVAGGAAPGDVRKIPLLTEHLHGPGWICKGILSRGHCSCWEPAPKNPCASIWVNSSFPDLFCAGGAGVGICQYRFILTQSIKETVTWKETGGDQGHCHTSMELLSLGEITPVLPPAYKPLRFFTAWKETNMCKTGGICQDPSSMPHLVCVIQSPYFIFKAN